MWLWSFVEGLPPPSSSRYCHNTQGKGIYHISWSWWHPWWNMFCLPRPKGWPTLSWGAALALEPLPLTFSIHFQQPSLAVSHLHLHQLLGSSLWEIFPTIGLCSSPCTSTVWSWLFSWSNLILCPSSPSTLGGFMVGSWKVVTVERT